MPKFNVHSDYFNHPKVRRLKLYCGKEADVFPIRLWSFCASFFPKDGILKGYTKPEIETILDWQGTPQNLINALVKLGFLDELSTGELGVHDWSEHAAFLLSYSEKGRLGGLKSGEIRRLNAELKGGSSPASAQGEQKNRIEKNRITTLVEPPKDGDSPTPEKLIAFWNTTSHPSLPKVQVLTPKRKIHILARLKEHPEKEFWVSLLDRVNKSPLLTGQSGNWKASFDWILNLNNMAKILEGNYDANKR